MLTGDVVKLDGLDQTAGWTVAGWTAAPADNPELDLRQLRHHMKNTLQRISSLVRTTPGLRATPAGRQLADEVEDRICRAAEVANAMFGLTRRQVLSRCACASWQRARPTCWPTRAR